MKNTIQLYIDEEKKIKGYPVTSHDRVFDENGDSIKTRLKNNVKFDIVGEGTEIPGIDGGYDDSDIKKQINTINEQLENKTDYPILDWENNKVVQPKYPYGDIRRYGAICNGIMDDGPVLQWALNNCCPNNITVLIPSDRVTVIGKEIVLKDNRNATWRYKLKSGQINANSCYLYQKVQNLFVGENFHSTPSQFTNISIEMDGVIIRATNNKNCVCFKAISLYSSFVYNCKFYYHYVVIEGSITTGTKFTRNRIQGFKYAVLSSISIINEEHDYSYIKDLFSSSSYNINSLYDKLVVASATTSDYTRFNKQSNDGYFDYNYIAGSVNGSYIPNAVFSIETIDTDFIINNNWFEFCKYVISPVIRISKHTDVSIIGTYFNDNVFQYFHRFFDPRSRYTSFTLNSNLFYSFSKTGLKSKFKNITDNDIEQCKSGVIIGDYTEENKPYVTKLILHNSYFNYNDYSIYFDNGNSGTSFRFTCRENNSVFAENKNSPFVRLRNIIDTYKINRFECFNNIIIENIDEISTSMSHTNTFIGQIVHSNGNIYMSTWNNNKPVLVPINNVVNY